MARRKRRSNRPHPPVGIRAAAMVAQAIADNNAGNPMNRVLLAQAMGYSPSSSGLRERIAAAAKYGLTRGNFNSEQISLTPLGVSVSQPRNEEERIAGLRKAVQKVPVFRQLLEHFSNSALPKPEFFANTLRHDPFNIGEDWASSASEAFAEDARNVGFLRNISGKAYVLLDGSAATPRPAATEAAEVTEPIATPELEEKESDQETRDGPAGSTEFGKDRDKPRPMQIFIAHGKNRRPLEQLKNILNMWKVPYLVAVDEANAGRPISTKVAEIMRECSAGIFIFTSDEELRSETGAIVARPSENVIYELGAASLLYGRKIVILKEIGVDFPSDFSDLGWIKFEKDALEAKAMDLLREMISLDALRLVSPTSSS